MRSREEIIDLARAVLCRDSRCQHHRGQAEKIVGIVERWLGDGDDNRAGAGESTDQAAAGAASEGDG